MTSDRTSTGNNGRSPTFNLLSVDTKDSFDGQSHHSQTTTNHRNEPADGDPVHRDRSNSK